MKDLRVSKDSMESTETKEPRAPLDPLALQVHEELRELMVKRDHEDRREMLDPP